MSQGDISIERKQGTFILVVDTPSPGRLSKLSKGDMFRSLGKNMGTKVKPVQPMEIKDKKIIREIIEQIRKPILPEAKKRHEEEEKYIRKFFK
jgi:hypothetical protein